MGSLTKPKYFFWIAGFLACLLIFAPPAFSSSFRGALFAALRSPLDFSSRAAQTAKGFFYFHKNAEENRAYRRLFVRDKFDKIQSREIRLENERLAKLLELKPSSMRGVDRLLYARVIARSPLAWNRTLWIDKGFEDGLRENLPVFSQNALAGKIIEARPGASKVLLLTDPNCKVGVLLERTRQQGVLFGTVSGECRMKYITDRKSVV